MDCDHVGWVAIMSGGLRSCRMGCDHFGWVTIMLYRLRSYWIGCDRVEEFRADCAQLPDVVLAELWM